MSEIEDRLVEKSTEAFVMGLEIYNKPTIKYRIEGFSFFICNAWELMLKAHLIKTEGERSIYFDDNPNRTISLNKCIELVYTNDKDPLRKNLERIIRLRDLSTHFITIDYEEIYAPLFQACVNNFSEQIAKFHEVHMTDYIAQNFLTLGIRSEALDETQIRQKYSKETAAKLLKEKKELENEMEIENERFSIPVYSTLYLTKKKSESDIIVGVDKNAEDRINVVKDMKNPNNMYPYTMSKVIKIVNRRLLAENIEISNNMGNNLFNSHDFHLFVSFYDIKSNERFTFKYEIQNTYSYSINLVNFIVEELRKNPKTLLKSLKEELKNTKK